MADVECGRHYLIEKPPFVFGEEEGDGERDGDDSMLSYNARSRAFKEVTPLIISSDSSNDWYREALCGVETQWNDSGIAIMAHYMLTSVDFPQIFSSVMRYAMYFPHATILLELS